MRNGFISTAFAYLYCRTKQPRVPQKSQVHPAISSQKRFSKNRRQKQQQHGKKNIAATEGFNEILLYTTPNGSVKVEIYLQNETIWLTQQKIAELFGVDRSVVSRHLSNIYAEKELSKVATCAKFAQVQTEGERSVSRQIEFYNLDAIISAGYRVNSTQATRFRIWGNERLKEYIVKGFTMDDERLKNPHNIFGKDYFEEQLARHLSLVPAI